MAAYKAGELTGEVVPLRGVPKGDVEMAMRVRQQSPTALTLKAVNPMDGHFVGSLEVTQEAAAEQLAEGGRAAGAPEPSGHRQESESLIQVGHAARPAWSELIAFYKRSISFTLLHVGTCRPAMGTPARQTGQGRRMRLAGKRRMLPRPTAGGR